MATLPVDADGEFGVEIRDDPPAHMLMKVQSFSKLWKHGIKKQESREFVAGNYKWRLIIYPQEGDDKISVYLSMAGTESLPVGWEVNAQCSILLRNEISNYYVCFRGKARRFDATSSRWGFSISKKMLNKFDLIVADTCCFGAEVFLDPKALVNECLSLLDWKITNFSKLKGVWTSEEFPAGGLRWKVKLFPNGNRDAKSVSVSIYLECVEAMTFSPHEKVKADFCLCIRNKLPHAHITRNTSHCFTAGENDWGFSNMIPISDMNDPSKGFLINDCCFLEAQLSVQDVVRTSKNVKGLDD
ncbi:uncharacterized protein LOC130996696 [Salvia miltiorrhiza]|uniref:uncharacterized protein LOC130996696 n=1 Tax=Salvia miltiorrhiza TaxID=226208 RepID=UPI0025AD0B82|nr:uncharacterized protein LOC130996696 [Salvia miltiorrhiza]